MNKYSLLKAITFVMAFNLNAQDFISHSVSPTTALKPQIKLNREEFFNSIFKEYEGIEQDKVLLNNYAAYCYKNCLKMLASNKEYESWQEGEKYLEKIVKETFSSRYPSHPIRIKIVRDASNNAAAYEDGTVYVNAGFLVHAETEAELAALLAHEIGHVVLHHNLDGYKSYQNYVTGTSIGNAAGGLSGMLIKYLSRNDLSHHSIRDEEAADLFAINALKKSNYSAQGMVSIFERFEKQSELRKSIQSFKTQRYFKSHPSNENRIKSVKEAFGDTIGRGRDFIVDSVYFQALKRRCVDESLYLLFHELDFNECLELAYFQHLKFPEDKFYLFFVQQSLVRLLKQKPELSTKRFITHRYSINNTSQIQKPEFIFSKFYKNKPLDFVYKQSVFYNLALLYNFPEKELTRLANKQLIANDTLEFINNEDALEYFRKKSSQLGCNVCSIDQVSVIDSIPKKSISDPLETSYLNLPASLKSFKKESSELNRKLFFICRYEQHTYYNFFDSNLKDESVPSKIYSNVLEDEKYKKEYLCADELQFNEHYDILNYFDKVQNELPDPAEINTTKYKLVNSKYFNCQEIFPELAETLRNHKMNQLNFLSINKFQRTGGGYTSLFIVNYDCVISCYSINFKNNTISKYVKNIGSDNTSRDITRAALEGFEELNKLVAKPAQEGFGF